MTAWQDAHSSASPSEFAANMARSCSMGSSGTSWRGGKLAPSQGDFIGGRSSERAIRDFGEPDVNRARNRPCPWDRAFSSTFFGPEGGRS